MGHRIAGVSVVLALGCAAPRPTDVPQAPRRAEPYNATDEHPGPSPALDDASSSTWIDHDWHRVYRGWSSLFVRDAASYLFTSDGAVNLSTQSVAFERDGSNWVAYQGDSLWFADHFSPMSACPEPSTLVQLVDEAWIPRLEANVHSLLVQPWLKGSSLAAIVPRRAGPPWGYELAVLERNRKPPRAARRSAHHLPECETRIAVLEALLAFPSGEVFVFGTECETIPSPEPEAGRDDQLAANMLVETSAPIVMESWRDGRHEFANLPFVELDLVEGTGPANLWATGSLADGSWAMSHYDGVSWNVLPERYAAPLDGLQIYDGSPVDNPRWLILSGGRLLERRGDEQIEHELPATCQTAGASASSLVLDGTELWLECREGDEPVLYTTRSDIAEVQFQTTAAERVTTSFTDEAHPRLDPSAPSLRACGSGQFRELVSPPSPRPSSRLPIPKESLIE